MYRAFLYDDDGIQNIESGLPDTSGTVENQIGSVISYVINQWFLVGTKKRKLLV